MQARRPLQGRQRLRSLIFSLAATAATGAAVPAWSGNVNDTVDQTAMAIPRIGFPGARTVALPQPLAPADAARVRLVFALQRAGNVTAATQAMDGIENDLLRGTILADRYLRTAYLPDKDELSTWLARFGDQPDAPAIRALLRTWDHAVHPSSATAGTERAATGQKPTVTVSARDLMTRNEDRAAIDAARSVAVNGPSAAAADSLFAGGVAAWRLNEVVNARPLFEAAWDTADTPAARAAAAFWLSRVAEHTRDHTGRLFWLRHAARETNTFYGPIARQALSPLVPCLQPEAVRQVITNADVDSLMATASGKRAFALLQVGERDRAEAELRMLWFDSGGRPALARSLALMTKAIGLNEFSDELRRDAETRDAAPGGFELPMLRPAGGFRMDPSFVYAVVRHESNFQPLAVSPVGARGLMQVMPGTAVSIGAIGDNQPDRLNDPSTNLAIGQNYLLRLARHPLVGDDLLRLIAAYGEGPNGMNRWAEGVHYDNDPFVFLEAVPIPFMRQFIEDVLIFQWQYAAALRLRASSLDDLAAGNYPRFAPIRAVPGGMRARPEMCAADGTKG